MWQTSEAVLSTEKEVEEYQEEVYWSTNPETAKLTTCSSSQVPILQPSLNSSGSGSVRSVRICADFGFPTPQPDSDSVRTIGYSCLSFGDDILLTNCMTFSDIWI